MDQIIVSMKRIPSWVWFMTAAVALILISAAFKPEKNCMTCHRADVEVQAFKPSPNTTAQIPAPFVPSETEKPIEMPAVVEQRPDQCQGGSRQLQIRSNEEFERIYISLRQPGEEKPGWHYLSDQPESPALLVVCDNVNGNFLIGFDSEFMGETLEIALLEPGQKIPLEFIACDDQPAVCASFGVAEDDNDSTFYLVNGKR